MSCRNPRRKTTGGRFARLPLSVLSTPAVTTLDHAAFRVLVLLAAQYYGTNNGALGITWTQAAANGIKSDNTLYAALRELETRGLIEQTYPASRVPPRPTMYAITWVSVDDTEYSRSTRTAAHSYRDWSAPPTARRRRRRTRLRVVTT